MAKATLIDAFLDAELRAAGRSLAEHLGRDDAIASRAACRSASRRRPTSCWRRWTATSTEGYRRIKLKIEPGLDVERVSAVRDAHPDILLSVDANAAYTLDDVDVFRALDELDLLMIEQPLHHDDLVEHAKLQARIRTDICLDESIRSAADAAAAIELGACRIINIKQGRVGGVPEARRIHDVARAAERPGLVRRHARDRDRRATNLALAALPGFTLPGRHERVGSLLRRRHHGAVRAGAPTARWPFPQGPGIGVTPRRIASRTTTAARRDVRRRESRFRISALLERDPRAGDDRRNAAVRRGVLTHEETCRTRRGVRGRRRGRQRPSAHRPVERRIPVLLDARSRRQVRARFGLSADGSAGLAIGDENGKVRATLGLSSDGSASLAFGDKNGRIRAKFGLAPEASPTLGMQVRGGDLHQVYSLAEQGSPTMGLYDRTGKVRVRLGLAAEGSPVLRLLDREGELRAVVGLAGDGSPFIQFMDEQKAPTWTMR